MGKAKTFGSSLGGVVASAGKFSLDAAGVAMKGIGIISGALGALGGVAVKMGMDFEAQMSKVGAISGATASDMELLGNKAKEMGAKTKFSATESGQAFEYMALAGWKTEQMLGGIEGIMNAAAASGEDLGLVADIITDSMTAFGKSAEYSSRMADILASASSNSNTNIAMLGESFKYVAPVAGAFGFSVEDTATSLGLMANSGIKASQAGTSFRQILMGLQGGATLTSSAFGELTISMENADGTMKPWAQTTDELRKAFSQMTEAEKAANAETIAGKIGMSGLLAIVNASPADYDKLTQAIQNSDGAAAQMAATMQDNLSGQITILKSGLEGLAIQFYESIDNPLKDVATKAQGYVSQLSEAFAADGLGGAIAQLGTIISDVVVGIAEQAPQMVEVAVSLIDGLVQGLTENSDAIMTGIQSMLTAIITGIQSLLPQFVPLALEIINTLVNGFMQWTNMLATTGIDIVTELITGLLGMLPTVLQAGIDIVLNVVNGIAQALPQLIPAAVDTIMKLVQTLVDNLPMILNAAMQLIMGLAQGIIKAIPVLIQALPGIINGIVKFLVDSIPQMIQAGIDLLVSLVEALPTIIMAIVEAIPLIIDGIIKAVITAIPMIIQAGIDLLISLVKALPQIIDTLIKAIPVIIASIVDALSGSIPLIIDAGLQILSALFKNVPMITKMIWTEVIPSLIGSVVDAIASYFDKMKDSGDNLIQGLWEGIKKAGSWLMEQVKGFMDGFVGGIKSFFGIQSPSKLFEKEIGAMLPAGMAIGIEKGTTKATKAAYEMAKSVYDAGKLRIKDYQNDSNYMVSEEKKMWESLAKMAKAGSKERVEAETAARKLEESALKEQEKLREQDIKNRQAKEKAAFDNSINWITVKKKLGLLSYDEEIAAYERMQSRYAEGSEYREKVDIALHETKKKQAEEQKEIFEEQQGIIDKMVAAEERYQKAVDDRTQAIFNSFGLFDQLKEKENTRQKTFETITEQYKKEREELEKLDAKRLEAALNGQEIASIEEEIAQKTIDNQKTLTELRNAEAEAKKTEGQILTENLQGQVDELKKWSDNMANLSKRGIDEGMLKDLQAMGPSANAEIKALTEMTEPELQKYSNLYVEKQKLARDQATTELKGLRKDTNNEIKGLMVDLNNTITKDSNPIGKNMVQGIIDGINSMGEALATSVKDIARRAVDAAKEEFQIASPSKVFKQIGVFVGEGFIGGLDAIASNVVDATSGLFGGLSGTASITPSMAGMGGTSGINAATAPIVINQYFYGVREERTAFEIYRATQRAGKEVFST